MFGFFSKKATISLELHSTDIAFAHTLSGDLYIVPPDDGMLESIDFEFNWNQSGVFTNDEPFKKSIAKSAALMKDQKNCVSFEVDFVTREVVNAWYRANSVRGMSAWSDLGDDYDGSANKNAFLEELKKWEMKVSVRIGGSQISTKAEFDITL